MTRKVLETDTHIYFLNGPFSNWHPMTFHGKLVKDGPMLRFNKREQYMMAAKAYLFGDQERLNAIMATSDASKQKELGRGVGGFTKETWDRDAAPIWNEHAKDIVFRACWYSAVYDEEYRNCLLNSGDKILVEGSIQDRVWGVGVAWDDPAILDSNNWLGTNWLGESHMEARPHVQRARLNAMKFFGTETFNPWTKTWTIE